MTAIAPSSPMSAQDGEMTVRDDVGGQLELEPEQQPHAEPPPDVLARAVPGRPARYEPDQPDEGFSSAEGDDENGRALDQQSGDLRQLDEGLLHVSPGRRSAGRCSGSRRDRWRCRWARDSAPPGGSAGSSSARTDAIRP